MLTSVSFIWIFLHQIPNEIFCCSKRRAQGVELVCGLRWDNPMPPGLWEYCVAHEKQTPHPPLTLLCTLDTTGRRESAFGGKAGQDLALLRGDTVNEEASRPCVGPSAFPTQSPSLWQLVTSFGSEIKYLCHHVPLTEPTAAKEAAVLMSSLRFRHR